MRYRKQVRFTLMKPSTLLDRQRRFINNYWTYQHKTLIYDNAPQFTSIDYSWYNTKGDNICTSAPTVGRKQAFCSPMHPGAGRKQAFCSPMHPGAGRKQAFCSPMHPGAGRKQAFCSPMHPGMNAYTERVNGTIRREAPDHFY
jgi:hypothetical protein